MPAVMIPMPPPPVPHILDTSHSCVGHESLSDSIFVYTMCLVAAIGLGFMVRMLWSSIQDSKKEPLMSKSDVNLGYVVGAPIVFAMLVLLYASVSGFISLIVK